MTVQIVEGVRSPFCKAGTRLDDLPAHELGARVLRELIERTEIDPSHLDAVVAGNVAAPMEATNVARVAALLAGVPERVPAHTVARNCASGMEAVISAARRIQTGECRMVAVVGVESMSRAPVVFPDGFRKLLFRAARARGWMTRLAAWSRLRPRYLRPIASLRVGLIDPVSGLNMGQTAELLAREFRISREAQDRYALRSHKRVAAAQEQGTLTGEIAPLFLPRGGGVVTADVGPRAGLTLAKLARLRPAFERDGTVTAGNSSMITDGAAALLIASAERCRELGLAPLARLRGHAVIGCQPARMGLGPVFAMPLALERAGVRLEDVGLIELNEAFAAQVIACREAAASRTFARRELLRSEPIGEIDDDRLNVDGGAIALGHPVGASGARLVLHLARSLRQRERSVGLATLCVGGGQGQAIVLEAAA